MILKVDFQKTIYNLIASPKAWHVVAELYV